MFILFREVVLFDCFGLKMSLAMELFRKISFAKKHMSLTVTNTFIHLKIFFDLFFNEERIN